MNVAEDAPVGSKFLYRRAEAAALLSVSLRTLDELIASGAIECKRLGSRVLIPKASLVEFAVEKP